MLLVRALSRPRSRCSRCIGNGRPAHGNTDPTAQNLTRPAPYWNIVRGRSWSVHSHALSIAQNLAAPAKTVAKSVRRGLQGDERFWAEIRARFKLTKSPRGSQETPERARRPASPHTIGCARIAAKSVKFHLHHLNGRHERLLDCNLGLYRCRLCIHRLILFDLFDLGIEQCQ